MLDWENAIALHAMEGNLASSVARGKPHGFSRVAAGLGVYSRVTAGMSIRNWSLFSELRTPL